MDKRPEIPEHYFGGVMYLLNSSIPVTSKPWFWIVFTTICLWACIAYKQLESTINPVMDNFSVENAWIENDALFIEGYMNKRRSCDFVGVSAYDTSGPIPKLLSLTYIDTPNSIKLIASHDCRVTGRVDTVLFDSVVIKLK